MVRKLGKVIAALAIAVAPIPVSAQSADEYRASFDQLLVDQSRNWAVYDYQRGSVGYPVVSASSADGRAILYAAAFRYTNGIEDVISVTVIDNQRTCVGYRSDSTACALGTRSNNGISGTTVFRGVVVGGALCAIFCSSGGRGGNGGTASPAPDTRNCSPAMTTGPNGETRWYYPCGQP